MNSSTGYAVQTHVNMFITAVKFGGGFFNQALCGLAGFGASPKWPFDGLQLLFIYFFGHINDGFIYMNITRGD